MGFEDTGLSNTTHNQDEVSPNRDLEQPRIGEDSDSDVDDDHWGDYMPLSQNPSDGEPLQGFSNESEDDDVHVEAVAQLDGSHIPDIKASSAAIVEEVWSKPVPKEVDIEMTEKKIDLVKQVMSKINLPLEAVPAWAKDVPEEEWKSHLLQKINNGDK